MFLCKLSYIYIAAFQEFAWKSTSDRLKQEKRSIYLLRTRVYWRSCHDSLTHNQRNHLNLPQEVCSDKQLNVVCNLQPLLYRFPLLQEAIGVALKIVEECEVREILGERLRNRLWYICHRIRGQGAAGYSIPYDGRSIVDNVTPKNEEGGNGVIVKAAKGVECGISRTSSGRLRLLNLCKRSSIIDCYSTLRTLNEEFNKITAQSPWLVGIYTRSRYELGWWLSEPAFFCSREVLRYVRHLNTWRSWFEQSTFFNLLSTLLTTSVTSTSRNPSSEDPEPDSTSGRQGRCCARWCERYIKQILARDLEGCRNGLSSRHGFSTPLRLSITAHKSHFLSKSELVVCTEFLNCSPPKFRTTVSIFPIISLQIKLLTNTQMFTFYVFRQKPNLETCMKSHPSQEHGTFL